MDDSPTYDECQRLYDELGEEPKAEAESVRPVIEGNLRPMDHFSVGIKKARQQLRKLERMAEAQLRREAWEPTPRLKKLEELTAAELASIPWGQERAARREAVNKSLEKWRELTKGAEPLVCLPVPGWSGTIGPDGPCNEDGSPVRTVTFQLCPEAMDDPQEFRKAYIKACEAGADRPEPVLLQDGYSTAPIGADRKGEE